MHRHTSQYLAYRFRHFTMNTTLAAFPARSGTKRKVNICPYVVRLTWMARLLPGWVTGVYLMILILHGQIGWTCWVGRPSSLSRISSALLWSSLLDILLSINILPSESVCLFTQPPFSILGFIILLFSEPVCLLTLLLSQSTTSLVSLHRLYIPL